MTDLGPSLRVERALVSIDNAISLISYGEDDRQIGQVVAGISQLLVHSDFVCIRDATQSDGTSIDVDIVHTDRPDSDSLPPSSIVFQALPGDDLLLPPALTDFLPHLGRVSRKETPAEMVASGSSVDKYEFDAKQPLFAFAHLDHPLAQAVAVTDMFSRLHSRIWTMPSPEGADSFDMEALETGTRILNSAMLIINLVGKLDESGDTMAWFDARVTNYADFLTDIAEEDWASPPEGSDMADAYLAEPLTEGMMAAHIHAAGWNLYAQLQGHNSEDAAYSIGKSFLNDNIY